MTWVKLSDEFPRHEKVDDLSDGAFRLHIAALCHASDQLTDGFVREKIVARLVPTFRKTQPTELVQARLWHPTEGGWLIHDYLDYNPSAESVRAERKAAADRMRNARSGKRSGEQQGERSGEQSANGTGTSGRSSGSPSSSPLLVSRPSSSSEPTSGEAPPDDDDPATPDGQDRHTAAIDLIARADLANRVAEKGRVPNPDSWLKTGRKTAEKRDGQALRRLATEHPDWSAERLAEAILRPPSTGPALRIIGEAERCLGCDGTGWVGDSVTRCPDCGGSGRAKEAS